MGNPLRRRFTLLAVCAVFLAACVPQAPAPYVPPLVATEALATKRYVAAGDRAYVIGTQDGAFPPMGWHIRGEMGGVWTPPVKLLDGYRFAINQRWLPAATSFSHELGVARMAIPANDGITITRSEFAPEGMPVVLVGLKLRNTEAAAKQIDLTLFAFSDMLATYPWDSSQPQTAYDSNQRDQARYDAASQTLVFQDGTRPWHAAIGTDGTVSQGMVGEQAVALAPSSEGLLRSQKGSLSLAALRQPLELPSNRDVEVWFAVAGSQTSAADAQATVRSALESPATMLAAKQRSRQELLARTQVELPDAMLQNAFNAGKLNLADLRRTFTNVQVRDVDQGRAAPQPVATFDSLTGIAGGYPDYVELFGTDGAYTAYPLMVSGQWDSAIAHLRAIRDVSRAINGRSGKVIHEITADGAVYLGANDDAGNTNETAQFALAVELVWQWTGDNAFRDEMYPFVRDGLRTITSFGDTNRNGCPEGLGMVERNGMAPEKLDVAAYTWRALLALEHMASSQGDTATVAWAQTKAETLAGRFDQGWWMESEQLYADSSHNCATPKGQVQQRHWIVATPLEAGLAPPDRAAAALNRLESDTFSAESGLYHTGVGGGPEGKGERRTWTLPTSVMAVAEANYGRLGDDQALRYMRAIAAQTSVEMPGALPEIGPSPEYEPLGDLRDRAMFMQAWSSYGIQWPLIHHIFGIRPDMPQQHVSVLPQLPLSWPQISVRQLRLGNGTLDVEVQRDGQTYTTVATTSSQWKLTLGHTLPAGAVLQQVTLNGKQVEYQTENTPRGRVVSVATVGGGRHSLVVRAAEVRE